MDAYVPRNTEALDRFFDDPLGSSMGRSLELWEKASYSALRHICDVHHLGEYSGDSMCYWRSELTDSVIGVRVYDKPSDYDHLAALAALAPELRPPPEFGFYHMLPDDQYDASRREIKPNSGFKVYLNVDDPVRAWNAISDILVEFFVHAKVVKEGVHQDIMMQSDSAQAGKMIVIYEPHLFMRPVYNPHTQEHERNMFIYRPGQDQLRMREGFWKALLEKIEHRLDLEGIGPAVAEVHGAKQVKGAPRVWYRCDRDVISGEYITSEDVQDVARKRNGPPHNPYGQPDPLARISFARGVEVGVF